jgi:hypothetical protein
VAQVIESLPSKHKSLSSNPNSAPSPHKNTFENHSSRLEYVEDRISGPEDKRDMMGKKTDEYIEKV